MSQGPSVSDLRNDVKVKRPNGGGSNTFITDSQLQEALAALEHRIVQKIVELEQKAGYKIEELESDILRISRRVKELEKEVELLDWAVSHE